MRGRSSVRIRVTVGQDRGYNTCDALFWPTSGPLWPTFFVTDVTDVTRHTYPGQKSGPGRHTYCWTFPWNCNEKSGWAIFCEIFYLIDDDDFLIYM